MTRIQINSLGACRLLMAVILTVTLAGAGESLPATAEQGEQRTTEAVLFKELPVVEAASLHVQSLREAPANVTVITAEDIRIYGYRTLGEALSSVRGFYISNDYIYQYLGLRGFSLPGDYSTRFLVMLNGHYLPDNIYSSAGLFGQDFGLDMDLVERIEIIRGPSSALYGSNGVFATINIVTKSPVEHPVASVSSEFGTFGEKKLHVSSSTYLGGGANLLISASAFHSAGPSMFFEEYDGPETNFGIAEGVGKEQGRHAFASLVWRDWTFTTMLSDRLVYVPTGWYETVFNDPGTKNEDGQSFVEAVYSRDIGDASQLQWRVHYDKYLYWARYDSDYEGDGVIWDNRELGLGDWIGSRLSYRFPVSRLGALTVGGEINADLRNFQQNADVFPEFYQYVYVNQPERAYGLFAQQEWNLSPRWTAYFGARFDGSRNYGHFLSPRIGFIYQRSPKTTYKFLYGRAFRNPNSYEKYYDDSGNYIRSNPLLGPEKTNTVEAVVEHKLNKQLNAVAAVYHYRLKDLIQGITDADNVLQYQNSSSTRATGAEFELAGRPLEWLEVAGSFAVQKVVDSNVALATINSPRSTAKFRFAVPLFTHKLHLSGAFRHLNARKTLSGGVVDPVWLSDLTLSTHRLHRNFDLRFGMRNMLDRRYYDPVGSEHISDRLRQRGRTGFVKLIWRPSQ
jgi:iron complex outermembrane receptor protein